MRSATPVSMCSGITRRGWRGIIFSITGPAALGVLLLKILPTILPTILPAPPLSRISVPDPLPGIYLPGVFIWCPGEQLGLPGSEPEQPLHMRKHIQAIFRHEDPAF